MGQLTAPSSVIGNVVVGGTPGSVLFVGAGSVLAQDNVNFFWNDTNNQLQLGIGLVGTPPYSFTTDQNSGLFMHGLDAPALVGGGLRVLIASSTNVRIPSASAFAFSSVADNSSGQDVILNRDAAAILAQRNGVNPQSFRIYNTFTDAANYERLAVEWSANQGIVRTQNAGTGAARSMAFFAAGGALDFGTANVARWEIGNTALITFADNTYDIGFTGANRPRTLFVGTSIQIEANQGLRFTNQVDGAAANAGTLGNAPSVGDPAFWIPITLNGNTRYIPAWT